MNKKMSYTWHLRTLMAERGHFATTDLVPLLAERGIHLSREQVYRMVTTTPQRLSLDVLAALCDILDADPSDLIEITTANVSVTKPADTTEAGHAPPVRHTTIRRPTGS